MDGGIKLRGRGRPSCAICNGRRLSWPSAGYTSAGPRTAPPGAHPMQAEEIRALRRRQREQGPSLHVFMSERDGPMTPKAFHALFGRIGARAKMQFPIHPHMLRHGCGYALANAGHDTRALQAW